MNLIFYSAIALLMTDAPYYVSLNAKMTLWNCSLMHFICITVRRIETNEKFAYLNKLLFHFIVFCQHRRKLT